MVEIKVIRWSSSTTFVEVRETGTLIYSKEYYGSNISDNPYIGLELMNFIDKNSIDYSTPVVFQDYKNVTTLITKSISLFEIKESIDFYKEWTSRGH
jgi:hypothetical protein